jgi:ABC-2 type transport system permease protein
VGPLIAVLAVNFAIIVSSRVSDPRVAEQISAVLIVPLIGVMFGQMAGLILINAQLMLATILILIILDIAFVFIGSALFQREYILTRWK